MIWSRLGRLFNLRQLFGGTLYSRTRNDRGVLQLGDELLVHPVIEILTPEDTWYDYEHRYTEGQSQHVMPAQITQFDRAAAGIALDAHRSLGLRDLSRADFIVTEK